MAGSRDGMGDLEKRKNHFLLPGCDKLDRLVTVLTELPRLITTKMGATKILNPASSDLKELGTAGCFILS